MDLRTNGRRQMAPTNLCFTCPDCQSKQSHCIKPGMSFERDNKHSPISETRFVVCDKCKMLYVLDIHPDGSGELRRQAMLVSSEPLRTKKIDTTSTEQPFFVELKDPLTGQWKVQSEGGGEIG